MWNFFQTHYSVLLLFLCKTISFFCSRKKNSCLLFCLTFVLYAYLNFKWNNKRNENKQITAQLLLLQIKIGLYHDSIWKITTQYIQTVYWVSFVNPFSNLISIFCVNAELCVIFAQYCTFQGDYLTDFLSKFCWVNQVHN